MELENGGLEMIIPSRRLHIYDLDAMEKQNDQDAQNDQPCGRTVETCDRTFLQLRVSGDCPLILSPLSPNTPMGLGSGFWVYWANFLAF